MKRDTERNEQHNKFTERQNREAVQVGEADMAHEALSVEGLGLVVLLRRRIAELEQELDMLKGNPDAVHKGAQAAVAALRQMADMKEEIAALRKALHPFAKIEVPYGSDPGTLVARTLFCNLQVTAFSVLEAREALQPRVPEPGK